jgi:membrane-bound serine protease (ClpP class)
MKRLFYSFLLLLAVLAPAGAEPDKAVAALPPIPAATPKKIYVIPIREEIAEPLVYVVRRGVKEAQEAKADAIILDMNTPGGAGEAMREIMEIVGKFEPRDGTYTYVNKEAFSAGAYISAATRHIYMAPGAVIGAATPVMMSEAGGAPQELAPKFVSAYSGMIRAACGQNGHRPEVFEAMVNKQKGLIVDGQELVAKGDILTLTTIEAAKTYGKPPTPLLSDGTLSSLDDLITKIGGTKELTVTVEPTGFEQISSFLVMLSPILLSAVFILGYIEFKTPGFGIFGFSAIACALVFFLGHYVAGLSGYENVVFFGLGILLILIELVFFPGIVVAGLIGFALVAFGILAAMTDRYPGEGFLPTAAQLEIPLRQLAISLLLSAVGIGLLIRFFPRIPLFSRLVLASNAPSPSPFEAQLPSVGDRGEARTYLRPSGTAVFNGEPCDVLTEGDFIESGTPLVVVAREGIKVVVKRA